ncbi:hypothetical protein FGO68_gene182 [Halteria grandinella]|uniref:Uncharacterized protein n=1 Tax=Halteria grandinella TaxID=5974 RepID=A0A8J8P4U1_HALGN|nr:hypothetical protein FGO68_gene182 [Halteria grandinella]
MMQAKPKSNEQGQQLTRKVAQQSDEIKQPTNTQQQTNNNSPLRKISQFFNQLFSASKGSKTAIANRTTQPIMGTQQISQEKVSPLMKLIKKAKPVEPSTQNYINIKAIDRDERFDSLPVMILGKDQSYNTYSEDQYDSQLPLNSPRFYASQDAETFTLPNDYRDQLESSVIPDLRKLLWKPPPINAGNNSSIYLNQTVVNIDRNRARSLINDDHTPEDSAGFYNFDKDIKEPCYYSKVASDLKTTLGLTPQKGYYSQKRIAFNQQERKQFLNQQNLSIAQIHAKNLKLEEVSN